jgi:predicted ATPase/transcriptional regulator with XRE-family HTH domain/Tfp pilus assembly protein PilF
MAQEPPRTFKDVLRQHRIAADLTQEELAEQAGLSTRAISDLERGVKQHPRKDTAQMLADGLSLAGSQREAFLAAARRPVVIGQPAAASEPRQNGVPIPPTPLIGRAREMAATSELLNRSGVRMLTLTGPGGVGKTRLALELAATPADRFKAVHFIPLTSLSDPTLVMTEIGKALGVREGEEPALREGIREILRDNQTLLVLDNFEHVVAATPQLAELLEACVALTVIVTSRVALRIRGEHEVPVEPLELPKADRLVRDEDPRHYPAMALFIERAQAIAPQFSVAPTSTQTLARICAHLDGLPLAIELAAAQVKVLSLEGILDRLERRLDLLTRGAHDLPARQQTMRATIAWSFDLLSSSEQALFRRFAVLSDGFTLEAAEAVGAASDRSSIDVLEGLGALIDKSLVRRLEWVGEPRFGMLETIREFGLEQLQQAGEVDVVHRAHADYFAALADEVEAGLAASEQAGALDRLESEHDNLRAALSWLLGGSDAERGLRLAVSLWWFWWVRGYLTEGRGWLARALAESSAAPLDLRARALIGAGTLAESQGDYSSAVDLHERALISSRAVGDERGTATALESLGNIAQDQGDLGRAKALFEEVLEHRHALDDRQGVAHAFLNLAAVATHQGDEGKAADFYTEALGLLHPLGDQRGIAAALTNLGALTFLRGDVSAATSLYEEALESWHLLGDKQATAVVLSNLGEVEQRRGNPEKARLLYTQARSLFDEIGDRRGAASVLFHLGRLSLDQGLPAQAAILLVGSLDISHEVGDREAVARCMEAIAELALIRLRRTLCIQLLGAAEALRESVGIPLPLAFRDDYERCVSAARVDIDDAGFELSWQAGRELSLEEAILTASAAVRD